MVPELEQLQAEAGMALQWMHEGDLADAKHSPFADYNQGVVQALRQCRVRG